jgi:uncharacterized membrane protein YsdA (DUF1294 family)/cold shock CspA family protein
VVSVRQKGKVTNWNSERGFGFVTPAGGGERVFLHVTAISDRRRPPADGDIVTYDLAFDEKKRPRAVNVRQSAPIRPKFRAASASASSAIPLIIAALFVLFVICETLAGPLPRVVITTYGAVSILTFLVYWSDKSAAQQGRWRTKESSLLFLGLACGWPGAVAAQRVLRHKSRKKSFQVAFWGTVVMNAVILGWLLTDKGSKVLDQLLR